MVSMIVAVDRNNAIGKDGNLLVHNPEDMKFFKEVTKGCNVIMGRNTWESLPMYPKGLPFRENYVVTSNPCGKGTVLEVNFDSIVKALKSKNSTFNQHKTFLIGGSGVYNNLSNYCNQVFVTRMDLVVEDADTFVDLGFLEDYKCCDVITLNDYSYVEQWIKK